MNSSKQTDILYVGTYTEIVAGDFGGHGKGISCYEFDAQKGELNLLNNKFQVNPSYLSIATIMHNNNEVDNKPSTYLFAVSEILASKKPVIHTYIINDNYSLLLIDTKTIEGGCPCHIHYFKNKDGQSYTATACYETGNLVIHTVDIEKIDNIINNSEPINIYHKGSSQHPSRQTQAHAHCSFFDIQSNKLLVCDLGLDQVKVYSVQKNHSIDNNKTENNIEFEALEDQVILLPAGSGPRHICFDENYSYGFIINELTGSVTIIKHSAEKKEYEIKGNFDVSGQLSESLKETINEIEGKSVNIDTDLGAAAIRVSKDAKFIYTSMRSDNTIRLFAFDPIAESLSYIASYPTQGLTPRDFTIDATGKWLLVAHQDSDTISIFNVNSYNGTLSFHKTVNDIDSPVCLAWLPK